MGWSKNESVHRGHFARPLGKVLEKVIPDRDRRDEIAYEIATQAESHAQAIQIAQIEVNKIEAAHKSLFVAGWRPFIGWVCGVAMGFNYLVAPVAAIWLDITPLDTAVMFPVLLGLLGLGGLRTAEKVKRVARES
jgi:hypothetical protein